MTAVFYHNGAARKLPDIGQGLPNAAYSFDQAGEYLISAQVENCGSFAAAIHTLRISSGPDPDLSISKTAPATGVANQPITYTLTLANSGALTATNLLVRDTLPVGATYLSGGSLVGNEVRWEIPYLGGYGQQITVTFAVSASSDVVNGDYGVSADGGVSAQGSAPVQTRIVDAQTLLSPVLTGTLSYAGNQSSHLLIPGGAVFADTLIAYEETGAPSTLGDLPYAGRAFRLDAYQENALVNDFRLYEMVHITLSYNPAITTILDPHRFTLRYWENDRWQGDGVACAADVISSTVHCTLDTPLLTYYALVERTYSVYLPLVLRAPALPALYAEITGISLEGSQYAVLFQTYGFTAQLPGQHVHFFFDTVPPEEAGLPGSGPWYVYGGPSPFTGYGVADRPGGATQMCVLVANHDHSVIQGSGNCYDLP